MDWYPFTAWSRVYMFRPPGALGLHFERDIQLGTVTISLLLILPPLSKKQRVKVLAETDWGRLSHLALPLGDSWAQGVREGCLHQSFHPRG